MKKRTLIIGLCIIACCFIFTANAYAGTYICIVTEVQPWSDGEVRLKVLPAPTGGGFTGEARLTIDTSQPGGKNMLATVLTAVSLGSEISVKCDEDPAWNPMRPINAVGLVAP